MPLDGRPSVSNGMNDVCAAALLADSGPATPAMAPVPSGGPPEDDLLFECVRRERREKGAATGQRTEHGAQQCSAYRCGRRAPRFSGAKARGGHWADRGLAAHARGQRDHDLRKTEQSDGQRHETDAVVQLGKPERESRLAGRDVEANGSEQQARHDHRDRLEEAAAGEHDRRDEAARHQSSVVRGFEARGHRRERSR